MLNSRGGCWLNDGAIISLSHSSFFMDSELQKLKLFTLRLKLFVTCARRNAINSLLFGLDLGEHAKSLAQRLFRCHFCLSITLLHESYSQASFLAAPKLSSSQSCHSLQSYCVTLTQPLSMLLPHQGQVRGCGNERTRTSSTWPECH